MNILVTGGAGFIGSHICKKLVEQGHHVICLDNLLTGSENNIAPLLGNADFKFIKHDILQPLSIKYPLDQIYNLACPASPVHYQADPVRTINTSTFGTYHLLELARTKKARLLHTSTSEVYGDPLEHPQKESYWGHVNPNGPRSCYDEGKRLAESLIVSYAKKYGVETRITRIFNTYGPNMSWDDGRAVSNFITQALQNKDLTIYGNGKQTRSFCYVDDLVEGIIRLMNHPDYAMPVNLGNPHEITISTIADLVLQLVPSRSKIRHEKAVIDDPTRRKPDITLAKKLLNWEPKISVEEGIKKTSAYFQKILINHI